MRKFSSGVAIGWVIFNILASSMSSSATETLLAKWMERTAIRAESTFRRLESGQTPRICKLDPVVCMQVHPSGLVMAAKIYWPSEIERKNVSALEAVWRTTFEPLPPGSKPITIRLKFSALPTCKTSTGDPEFCKFNTISNLNREIERAFEHNDFNDVSRLLSENELPTSSKFVILKNLWSPLKAAVPTHDTWRLLEKVDAIPSEWLSKSDAAQFLHRIRQISNSDGSTKTQQNQICGAMNELLSSVNEPN